MGRIEDLAARYRGHIGAPWQRNLAGDQKAIFVVYPKTDERKLRAGTDLFEMATTSTGHRWRSLDLTDTFARGFMQTFSDMARRYGVYVLGSNSQAPFRESTDPADVDALADPDLPRPRSVFVATSDSVYNEAFMWAPHDVRGNACAVFSTLRKRRSICA